MSRINDRDYLYVIWKDYKTRQRYIVGELSKNGKFEFKYRIKDLDKAIEKGFKPLIAFANINEVYESYNMFPAFSSRLPDKRRRDIKEILEKYKLEKYDAFELLKKSGGKLPIDSLEFIDPIFLDEVNIVRKFYIAGVKYYDYCNGKHTGPKLELEVNEDIALIKDSNNRYDEYAVKVMNGKGEFLGFIPSYFSEKVRQAINSDRKITCTVINKDCNDTCEECIKVKLTIV